MSPKHFAHAVAFERIPGEQSSLSSISAPSAAAASNDWTRPLCLTHSKGIQYGQKKGGPTKPAYSSLVETSMLPWVALEYGQMPCAASSSSRPTSGSTPGMLALRRARRKKPPFPRFRSISASIAGALGSLIFLREAASSIAPMKQADQAAAKSRSAAGCGSGSRISRLPSLLRVAPSVPPVVKVLPVKRSFRS
jgi:hypothetical protein